MLGGNRESQRQRRLGTYFQELILDSKSIKIAILQVLNIILNKLSQHLFIIDLAHPQRKAALEIIILKMHHLDLPNTSREHGHFPHIESNPAHRIIEVTLRKIQLNGFLVIIRTFEGVFDFYHYGEVGGGHA
jgi:hypothetical protein